MPQSMIDREAVKFKNYWLALPGSKGVKCDWHRTWENWCIQSIEWAARDQKARGNKATAMTAALQARTGPQEVLDAFWSGNSADGGNA